MDARIVDGRKIARVTDDGKLEVLVHGRDGDNLVPVKVSEDGYLMLATDVTVDLGTVAITAEDIEGNPVALSAEKDPDGKAVLRIVDAATFAYNKETERFMVETETTTIETLMNAVSVPAQGGTSQVIEVKFTSEQEAWFFLSVDKQPWRLQTSPIYASASASAFSQMFFPNVGGPQTSVHTINTPLLLLFLPTRPDPAPSSLEEARLYPLTPGKMPYRFVFRNESDEIATVTLKLLRVRR